MIGIIMINTKIINQLLIDRYDISVFKTVFKYYSILNTYKQIYESVKPSHELHVIASCISDSPHINQHGHQIQNGRGRRPNSQERCLSPSLKIKKILFN